MTHLSENIKSNKSGIAGLIRRRRFIPYLESFELARKLEALIQLLDSENIDPKTGVGLMLDGNIRMAITLVRQLNDGPLVEQLHRADYTELHYEGLPPLAKCFENESFPEAATVIYRALLDDLLDERRYKAYGHGARHLRRLDALAEKINEWGDLPDHASYASSIREKHGKKSSFWKKYEKYGP